MGGCSELLGWQWSAAVMEELRGKLVTGNGGGGHPALWRLRWSRVQAKEGTRMGNEGAGLERAVLGC